MSLEKSNRKQFLMESDFNVSSYPDASTGALIYLMSNWYAVGSNLEVPLVTLSSGMEPFSYEDNVLKVGGATGGHATNQCWIVSKSCFKYNPTKYYRVRVRAKFSAATTTFTAGFVGLTSVPISDMFVIDSNADRSEVFNVSRFAIGMTGGGVLAGADLSSLPHFNCIRATGVAPNVYMEFEGIIQGKSPSVGYGDGTVGLTASNPLNLRNEVLYFSPYMLVNELSSSRDAMQTYIDYMTVEEIHDVYMML
jgi:hypothetical protein